MPAVVPISLTAPSKANSVMLNPTAPINLDPTKVPVLDGEPVADANDAFQKDWAQAQILHDRAIQSGDRTPEEADAIYFAPLRSKWQLAAATPKLLDDPVAFKKFNSDFQSSKSKFDAAVSRGDDPLKAASSSINPTLMKWQLNPTTQETKRQTEAEIESANAVKPELVASEKSLNTALDAAKDNPFDVVSAYYAHPDMLNTQPFARRNTTLYREARAKILSGYDSKGIKPQSVVQLNEQKKVWEAMKEDKDLPPDKMALVEKCDSRHQS